MLAAAGVERAAGFVAGTDNDTTNLSLVAAAHRRQPAAVRRRPAEQAGQRAAVRRRRPRHAAGARRGGRARGVRAAVDAAAVAVPAGDARPGATTGPTAVVGRLTNLCGKHLQSLWKVRLSARRGAGAARRASPRRPLRLGDLLRSPDDRDEHLHAVVLLVARGDDVHLAPPDDFALEPDDELLLVGAPAARRLLDSTLLIDATREYVLHGRHVPSSWIWRRITRRYT